MNKQRMIVMIAAILIGGGLLLWMGLAKSRPLPIERQSPSSMKASVPSEGSRERTDLMSFIRERGKEYAVQPGDNLTKIAKQHNTTVDLLRRLNGLESDLIRTGQTLKVPAGIFDVLVSKSENELKLLLDGVLVRTYPVSIGSNDTTPIGDFTVVSRLVNPVWYKTGAVIPPDSPENVLGSRWLGIASAEHPTGYGIHGTIEPEKIGQAITAGCVRMRNEDVEELYAVLPQGASVKITN